MVIEPARQYGTFFTDEQLTAAFKEAGYRVTNYHVCYHSPHQLISDSFSDGSLDVVQVVPHPQDSGQGARARLRGRRRHLRVFVDRAAEGDRGGAPQRARLQDHLAHQHEGAQQRRRRHGPLLQRGEPEGQPLPHARRHVRVGVDEERPSGTEPRRSRRQGHHRDGPARQQLQGRRLRIDEAFRRARRGQEHVQGRRARLHQHARQGRRLVADVVRVAQPVLQGHPQPQGDARGKTT